MTRFSSALAATPGAAHPPDDTPRISVDALCAALDSELIGAAKLALSLQETVSHLTAAGRLETDDMRRVQNLDRLTQVLNDLAAVVRLLPSAWAGGEGRSAPHPSLSHDSVTQVVHLHDVAAALLGQTLLPCSHVGTGGEAGQVDWL